jgi:N-acetylglucosamine transport system substrate-binding protein
MRPRHLWPTLLIALAGCTPGGSEPANSSTSKGGATEKTALTGKVGEGTIEVQAFKGGYDIDFYQAAASEYAKAHSGIKVTVDGDPKIWEKLRPRLVSGTPPDLMFPGWGLDHWALVEDGGLLQLDDALSGKPAEGDGTWRDTFEPALLKLGQQDGKQYVMPYYFNVWGMWYLPDLFAKNGWTVPKSYDDLLALCEKIKAKGIAPITFQGQYPYYMLQGMFLPWVQDLGGMKAVDDLQNLTPGAWKSDAVLKVAAMIKELKDKGDFQQGAVGLSHTESQTAFVNGKAAMIPCGTWLQSEMAKTMPPGTKLAYFNTPAPSGSGDATAVCIDIEPWMVPAKAKNQAGAIDLFKYMTSKSVATKFVEQKGTLMAVKGSADTPKLPEVLKAPLETFKNSKATWSYQARYWYPEFEKEIEGALTALVNGDLTPQAFGDRIEAKAEALRKDENVKKHKLGA